MSKAAKKSAKPVRKGKAVVGVKKTAAGKPLSSGQAGTVSGAAAAQVVDAGAPTVNEGKSHLPTVDAAARVALKAVARALAGLTGLDSGETALVKDAVARIGEL
jgi:hypothetical protein